MESSARRLIAVAVCALAAGLPAETSPVAGQRGGQAAAPPQEQRPVFRTGTNFVQVDAYPRRDGRIVEGLTAKDFQVYEDGKLQSVAAFEFIRVEPNTPEADRRDPNSQAEGNALAADPRNRVFVLYLDHYHSSLSGSHGAQRPIVDMLNRMLAPNDLFTVATVRTRPRDLILARQTLSIEEQLARHWTWGWEAQGVAGLEPEEQVIQRCYGDAVALAVASRTREERTFDAMQGIMRHLGAIREARKFLVVFTNGWPLYRPDEATLNRLLGADMAARPRVGVSTGGKLTTSPASAPGMADWSQCNVEIARAYQLDNYRKFTELIRTAQQNNVAVYPVNPAGMGLGGPNAVHRSLADETGGLTSATNDVGGLLRRIADDVSAYYLLGYYSSNTASDGTFRRIEVKMADSSIRIQARRGYLAANATETTLATSNKPAPPEGLEEALGQLSRLRPSSELFSFGAATATEIAVSVELASQMLNRGAWGRGASVSVTVANPLGEAVSGSGQIEPGQRGVIVRVARPSGSGPYQVTVRASAGDDDLADRVDVESPRGALTGAPMLFRATPSARSPLWPVADFQYRRTERVHIEWPILAALDRRGARLLSKEGQPLPIPVTVTERTADTSPVLAADISLAPLAAGDYVIELTVGSGEHSERRFVAIRVRS